MTDPKPDFLRLCLDDLHRADVIKRLVAGAAQGDVDAFLGAIAQVMWPGGWVDALCALVPLKTVPSVIQDAFATAWRGSASREFGLRRFVMADLVGQDRLVLDGLAVLLPPVRPDPMPATLYRVSSLVDYDAGRLGLWWTAERDLAPTLWLLTSALSEWDGNLVVLAADAPASAIVYGANDLEVLLDPRRLGPVRKVGMLQEDELVA